MATKESFTSYTENLQKYLRLDQKGQIMVEYVWVDAEGGVRSKSRVSSLLLLLLSDLPRALHFFPPLLFPGP